MQRNCKTAAPAELEVFFLEPSNYVHTADVAALVLERLPSGELEVEFEHSRRR